MSWFVTSDQFRQLSLLWRRHKVKAGIHCTDEAQNQAETRVCSYLRHVKGHLFTPLLCKVKTRYPLGYSYKMHTGLEDKFLILYFDLALIASLRDVYSFGHWFLLSASTEKEDASNLASKMTSIHAYVLGSEFCRQGRTVGRQLRATFWNKAEKSPRGENASLMPLFDYIWQNYHERQICLLASDQ